MDCKEIQPVHSKEDQSWVSLEGIMLNLKVQYFGYLMRRVDSLEKHWCWEGLGAGGIGDDRGWDGWLASRTWWMWVRVNSGSWWWRPGMLQFMESQRVRHNWVTELNWTDCLWNKSITKVSGPPLIMMGSWPATLTCQISWAVTL